MGKRRTTGLKDPGIVTLKSKMSTGETIEIQIPEELRDAIQNKYKDHRNRPTHMSHSNMTTSQLKAAEFSGFRLNALTDRIELWCLGRVAATENAGKAARNPALLADMHERAFATKGSLVEFDLPEKKPEDLN